MEKDIHNKQSLADITRKNPLKLNHYLFYFRVSMIAKCAVIFFLMQVCIVEWTSCRHLSLFHVSNSFPGKSSIFDWSKKGPRRGKRCLTTALSLLWPQVVGPVEQGIIAESDYNEVPKTVLEYRLDLLRKKAAEEEESRLMVRDYLKKLTEAQDDFYGYQYPNSLTNEYT